MQLIQMSVRERTRHVWDVWCRSAYTVTYILHIFISFFFSLARATIKSISVIVSKNLLMKIKHWCDECMATFKRQTSIVHQSRSNRSKNLQNGNDNHQVCQILRHPTAIHISENGVTSGNRIRIGPQQIHQLNQNRTGNIKWLMSMSNIFTQSKFLCLFLPIFGQTWCMWNSNWNRYTILGLEFGWKDTCDRQHTAFRTSHSSGIVHVRCLSLWRIPIV